MARSLPTKLIAVLCALTVCVGLRCPATAPWRRRTAPAQAPAPSAPTANKVAPPAAAPAPAAPAPQAAPPMRLPPGSQATPPAAAPATPPPPPQSQRPVDRGDRQTGQQPAERHRGGREEPRAVARHPARSRRAAHRHREDREQRQGSGRQVCASRSMRCARRSPSSARRRPPTSRPKSPTSPPSASASTASPRRSTAPSRKPRSSRCARASSSPACRHARQGVFTRFLFRQTDTPLQWRVWQQAGDQLHLARRQIGFILANWWSVAKLNLSACSPCSARRCSASSASGC